MPKALIVPIDEASTPGGSSMQVEKIMNPKVVWASPTTTYKELVELLLAHEISGVPVVDDAGVLLGVVTEADLLARSAFAGERPRALAVLADVLSAREHHWVTKALGWTAADMMSRGVVTCSPVTEVHTAARLMLDHDITRLPVVLDGRVVGIVSRRDVLQALARPDADIAADVTRMLASHPNRPEDHHVISTVKEGKVTLTGDVRYAHDAPILVHMVRDVDGVIGVESRLHHREPTPPGTTAPSPWMTPTVGTGQLSTGQPPHEGGGRP